MIIASTDDVNITEESNSYTFANVTKLELMDSNGNISLDTENGLIIDDKVGNIMRLTSKFLSRNGMVEAGGTTNRILVGKDLNLITDPGMYRLQTGNSNVPASCEYSMMLVIGLMNDGTTGNIGSDTRAQIIFPYAREEFHFRNGNPLNPANVGTGRGWRNWRKI